MTDEQESLETPLAFVRVVELLAHLNDPAMSREDRREAVALLVGHVRQRLTTVAASVNESLGGGEPIPKLLSPTLYREIEAAVLMTTSPHATTTRSYYERAAEFIRGWLLTWLKLLAVDTEPGEARRQITAWESYHRKAGRLPAPLKVIHDLTLYAGLAHERTMELLAITPHELETRRLELLRLITPLLGQTRAKRS